MELADKLLLRLKGMESQRAPYDSTRKDLAELYLPHKKAQDSKTPGEEGTERIWDSTPAHALQTLAARIYTLEMNPADEWLGIGFRDMRDGLIESDEFKQWASKASTTMLDILANEEVNAYTAHHQCTTDKVLFGAYAKFIEEDDDTILREKALPLEEVYVSEAANGIVDTVYRKYSMTARQVVQQWGSAKVSERVRKLLEEDKPEEPVQMLHAIYPRGDIGPDKIGNKAFPIASVYMEIQDKHVLEEGGYHEMPISFPRWETGSGESYGRGPAITALADTRVLYAQIRSAMVVAEKMAAPVLLMSDDDALHNPKPDIGPNGILYYRNPEDKPQYLTAPGDLSAIGSMVDRSTANIRQIYLSNELDDENRPVRTATEAQIKQADRLQQLSAVVGRGQSEGLTVEVRRRLGILMRKGIIDPLPEGYTMRHLRFFYRNPVTQTQKMARAQELQVFMEIIGMLTPEGQDPFGVMDWLDTDKIPELAREVSGLDPKYLRSKQKVEEIRGQRAQAQQQAQAIATAGQVADVAATASKADMSKPNGLTALVGGTA